METLNKYGLNDHFIQQAAIYPALFAARVIEQRRELYKVVGTDGEMAAEVSGRLAYLADSALEYPAVGDWVMVDRPDGHAGQAMIRHILRRQSVFVRQTAGTAQTEQVIAANIDLVFICMSLNADFNLRRLERYLTIAWESLATPVLVLTKSDICEDVRQKTEEAAAVSGGVELIVCSTENDGGLAELKSRIGRGKTVAFIGSSGVGKSTLINRLLGREILFTQEIREGDDKGRHTTTHRQLLLLPGGGIVIDTPGMRELRIYTGNVAKAFEDIEELAARCKYRDCTHAAEPGCAVRKAVKDGVLAAKRLENYQKLRREVSYDGLNSRQVENEKIQKMFGGKAAMKQMMKQIKGKNSREQN